MARAYSPTEIINLKKKSFDFSGEFHEAFGNPEMRGVWFIWGQSGNGKSSFVMQLCKELCKFGKVGYNALEEGTALTMKNTIIRFRMEEENRRFQLIDRETVGEMTERLTKKHSVVALVIDSFQYTQLTYKQYIDFKNKHRDKLLIFVSHADGKQPAGRSARSVMYDADMKIYVEGYMAMSKGRYYGPNGGRFTVWDEGAARYWGEANN